MKGGGRVVMSDTMECSVQGGSVGRDGFTLVEMLVVLILMGIAVAVVAPALLPPGPPDTVSLEEPLRVARRLALTRGETVYLDLVATGEWTVVGGSSLDEGVLARGRVDSYQGPVATLVASPLGTCSYDIYSVAGGGAAPIDPLSCMPVRP